MHFCNMDSSSTKEDKNQSRDTIFSRFKIPEFIHSMHLFSSSQPLCKFNQRIWCIMLVLTKRSIYLPAASGDEGSVAELISFKLHAQDFQFHYSVQPRLTLTQVASLEDIFPIPCNALCNHTRLHVCVYSSTPGNKLSCKVSEATKTMK